MNNSPHLSMLLTFLEIWRAAHGSTQDGRIHQSAILPGCPALLGFRLSAFCLLAF